jgi:hypothetical protein
MRKAWEDVMGDWKYRKENPKRVLSSAQRRKIRSAAASKAAKTRRIRLKKAEKVRASLESEKRKSRLIKKKYTNVEGLYLPKTRKKKRTIGKTRKIRRSIPARG